MGNIYQPQRPLTVIGRRFPAVRNHRRRILAQYDFAATTGIANGYAGGTDGLAVNSTNYRIGTAGITMPVPAGQTQFRYNNPSQWSAFDISGGSEVEVSWYNPAQLVGSLRFGLCSNNTVNQWAVKVVTTTGTDGAHKAPGWHRERFGTTTWEASSNFDAANVTGWEARLTSSEAGAAIVLDQIKVLRPQAKPIVIFRNDDAIVDVMAMAAYLEKYGYYLLTGAIGNNVGTGIYATVSQLRELADRGHLVVSHTWSHKDWTTLTVQQCVDEVRRNYDWLVKNHLGRGAGVLISPYFWQAPAGSVEELMGRCQGMVDMLLVSRNKHVGYPESGETINLGVPNGYDSRILGIVGSDSTLTASYIENTVAASPGPRVLLYHHLDRGGITSANFRLAVDKVAELDAAKTIDVLTLDEYLLRAATEEY